MFDLVREIKSLVAVIVQIEKDLKELIKHEKELGELIKNVNSAEKNGGMKK